MLKILYYNEDAIINSLAESLVISGFPMSTKEYTRADLHKEIHKLYIHLHKIFNGVGYQEDIDVVDKYLKRGENLGNTPIGSGHSCYLKGVQFNMIVNAPLYWMKQYQRYHFTDIISSQSTMHRIHKMDLKQTCNNYVDDVVLNLLNDLVTQYNEETDVDKKKELFNKIVSNCPSGLTLTMGITMNYLQLVSMHKQREHHKLDEWGEDFVMFCEELPFFNRLTQKHNK